MTTNLGGSVKKKSKDEIIRELKNKKVKIKKEAEKLSQLYDRQTTTKS